MVISNFPQKPNDVVSCGQWILEKSRSTCVFTPIEIWKMPCLPQCIPALSLMAHLDTSISADKEQRYVDSTYVRYQYLNNWNNITIQIAISRSHFHSIDARTSHRILITCCQYHYLYVLNTLEMSQTIFSWMVTFKFQMIFDWNIFYTVLLTICHNYLIFWLGAE